MIWVTIWGREILGDLFTSQGMILSSLSLDTAFFGNFLQTVSPFIGKKNEYFFPNLVEYFSYWFSHIVTETAIKGVNIWAFVLMRTYFP